MFCCQQQLLHMFTCTHTLTPIPTYALTHAHTVSHPHLHTHISTRMHSHTHMYLHRLAHFQNLTHHRHTVTYYYTFTHTTHMHAYLIVYNNIHKHNYVIKTYKHIIHIRFHTCSYHRRTYMHKYIHVPFETSQLLYFHHLILIVDNIYKLN